MPISDRDLRKTIVDNFKSSDLDAIRADVQEKLRQRNVKIGLSVDDLGGTEKETQVLRLIDTLKRRNLLQMLIDALIVERPDLADVLSGAASPVLPEPEASAAPPKWQVDIRMKRVPTSIYHVLKKDQNPLFTCTIHNEGKQRNVKLTAEIAAYSSPSYDDAWLEPGQSHTFSLLPRFKPNALDRLTEIKPASLDVKVDDLTFGKELGNKSFDLSLYPTSTVLLEVQDVLTKEWKDMTQYVAAFVTPNAPAVQDFIRRAADRVDEKAFVGYQGGAARVLPQVRGLFEAFKGADITYSSFVQAFGNEPGVEIQRVQLPRQSLNHRLANCIDGQVLFASALEGINLSAALVYIQEPAGGHALVGWETEKGNDDWQYLDTTKIKTHLFDSVTKNATNLAKAFEEVAKQTGDPRMFRRWPLRTLRALDINPME